MDSEILKVNDAEVQSLGLKFAFSTEGDKLIIEAFCLKDNQKYVGEIITNPYVDLQDIKELLSEGQFKTLLKNEEILKIKAGPVPIELLTKQKSEIKVLKETLIKSLEKQAQMQAIIDFQNVQLDKHENMIKDLKTKFNFLEQSNQKIRDDLKQQVNNLIEKVNPLIKNIEQEKEKQQRRKMIESFEWSEQLKSQNIKISGNVVTITKELQIQKRLYYQFCLLNASFSNKLKYKQSWAIKINKKKNWTIYLGVCLKSKMIEYNFNDQNINWNETGHGFYMIGSGGLCLSHSQKEFNYVKKNFEFDSGDVLYFEYDPIECKLRFIKNLIDECFELSIIAPPQNDAYHPCVQLYQQDSSVELIQPTQINK